MSSFFKSIFHSSNKHKKLCEEWTNNREPVVDGITFYVRYLGSSLVEDPKSGPSTAAGVKRVIHAAKAGGRRPDRVAFRVSMEGVRIESAASGDTIMDTSIYKISYCSADSQYDQVLAFVASNENDTCECHAFLCSKRKVAEAIAVSIAQAFTMAYECWKIAIEAKRNGQNDLAADQKAARGEQTPVRNKDSVGVANCSRSSSPGHSPGYPSTQSEVSSTSGYQSSTTGGLLLELDYTDAGSEGALPLTETRLSTQQQSTARGRKHWTSFDDVSEMTEDLGRLISDPPKNCFPWGPPCIPPAVPVSCGSSPLDWPAGRKLLPPAPVMQVEETTGAPRDETVPSGATSTAAAVTHYQTQSNNSSRQQTKSDHLSCKILQSTEPDHALKNLHSNKEDNLSFTHPPYTKNESSYKEENPPQTRNFINSMPKLHLKTDFISNPTNSINKPNLGFPNVNMNTSTKISCRSELLRSSQHNVTKFQKETNQINGIKLFAPVCSSVCNGKTESNSAQHKVDAAFRLNCGGISVPRVKWESFDSSSPPVSSVSTSNAFSDSFPRSQSPISAFLDSCLTPRPEEDDKESKFAFFGSLSGEGHIFNTNHHSDNTVSDGTADESLKQLSKPIGNGLKKRCHSGNEEAKSCSSTNLLPTRGNGSIFGASAVDPFRPLAQLPPEAVR